MTAPAGLFDEFLPPEGERGLFDEFVPKEEPRVLPKLKGRGMEVASSSTTRTVNGPPDPDSWMTAMRRPGAVEQVAGGVLGMPFQMAAHPIESVKQMAKDVVMSPARLGMYAAKKMNEPLGIATPEPFNVSGLEATMDALNVALMAGGGLKASLKPKVKVPIVPTRAPRPGIVRVPAALAKDRLASVGTVDDILTKLREPEAIAGDVPLNVPMPPAERAYPLGTTVGGGKIGARTFDVPPTPYTRPGVKRRPASNTPLFDEFLPADAKSVEPIPTIGEPVSVGTTPLGDPRFKQAGKEPTFNVGDVLPDETASVGKIPEPPPRPFARPKEVAPIEVGGALRPIEGTGELKTRGLPAGVEEKAIASKLTTSLGDLPEYRTINMADQATKATKLLAEDADMARRVALGEAPPPADLLPESVFVAVENKALAAGDVGTLRELASGRLTEEATTMGQRIRALAERDPDSPVAAMQKIVDARVKGAKDAPALTANTVKELQQHIAQAVQMDPPAWTKFIDSLRC